MQYGKTIDVKTFFPDLPARTNSALYDDNGNLAAFVCNANRTTPQKIKIDQIREIVRGSGWKAFPDSNYRGVGRWIFFAVVHREDIPRDMLENKIKF